MNREFFPALNRRQFLKHSAGVSGLVALGPGPLFAQSTPKSTRLKAVIIGHTGRGDYGHGLDILFNDRSDIEVVAVADPDEAGRAKAAERCKAPRQYADYRQMLEKEKPQLVSVAPRWTDQHHAMALAALRPGAHVITEKPFTQTLEEADQLLAVAEKAGLKTAVAHQMRLAPSIQFLKQALESGAIGELLSMHAHGKQDSRAGGEDMLVLGTHLFDLMRVIGGDAIWCTAHVSQSGHEVTLADAKSPSENIGPVLGDEIEAQFFFPKNLFATFISRGKHRQTAGPWGIELIGSTGVIRILAGVSPQIFMRKSGTWSSDGATDEWRRVEGDPTWSVPEGERGFLQANKGIVDDLLAAIRENREPACSGRNAMKALEMVMAVFQAALSRGRVQFPLTNRKHPLGSQPAL